MRINHLDGLRGVAILMVYFYHAFSRWTDIMPYGDAIASFPLFQYGKYGVQLFFLLSGFVIYLTLERSRSIPTFLYKRWLRLFPAMVVCSLIIFFTSMFFVARPAGLPNWVDLLPGLTLIEPYYLSIITGLSFDPLEASFWSIYVEVKFYLFAAIVYFLFSKQNLPWFIVAAFFFWWVIVKAPIVSEWTFLEPIRWRLHFTSLEYFGWFACGCFCYQYKKQDDVRKLIWAISLGAICIAVASNANVPLFFVLTIILALFVGSLTWQWLQAALSSPILLFFGFISYPLYLLHENLMVSSVIQLTRFLPTMPSLLWPLLILSLLAAATYVIAKYLEPFLKSLLIHPRLKIQRAGM